MSTPPPVVWFELPSGWSVCSFAQTTRVHRYLEQAVVQAREHAEQRLYLVPPHQDRLDDVPVWTVNGHYRIELDTTRRLVTFRDSAQDLVTTDPMFWCQVDGRWAIECSLYDPSLQVGQPARLQGWSTTGEALLDGAWTPQDAPNRTNDQLRSQVRWDGRRAVLTGQAQLPFSLTVQTLRAGRFRETTEVLPAGTFERTFDGWFSDYVGLCLSAQDYEEKHILVGRFGDGSGRWRFDPLDGVWSAPPSGDRYHHRSVVVPWCPGSQVERLEAMGLAQAHEIEWWVPSTQTTALPVLKNWALARGIPSQAQVFGPTENTPWWLMDPLDPVQVARFRTMPARAVMMLPFTEASTVDWGRVQAAFHLATERPDHQLFEAGWWGVDGESWNPWNGDAHHRTVGHASHGVGFMRPVAATARALVEERKRRLPRHPCQQCPEQSACAQRTPFPLPAQPWSACRGWANGPLMGPRGLTPPVTGNR